MISRSHPRRAASSMDAAPDASDPPGTRRVLQRDALEWLEQMGHQMASDDQSWNIRDEHGDQVINLRYDCYSVIN